MNFELIDKNSYFYTWVGFQIHKIKLSDISDIVIVAQNENDNIQMSWNSQNKSWTEFLS